MSISLSSLATRLQSAVPARNSVPSSGDYEQHVKDAMLQLSQDAPLRRTTTLSIVSGTASYDLPSDFLSLVELVPLVTMGDVYITDAGLVPLATAGEPERITVEGDQLVIYPTPTYSTTRTLYYLALYEMVTGAYARLTENGSRVALFYAQYLALNQQANAIAGDGWSYQIGDERVDKSRQGQGLREQAAALLSQYRAAIKAQQGYGGRARHTATGVAY